MHETWEGWASWLEYPLVSEIEITEYEYVRVAMQQSRHIDLMISLGLLQSELVNWSKEGF